MINKTINLADFKEDPSFFNSFELLLTVKSFDLDAIRKRYVASLKRNKTGSVERRQPATGGVVYLKIESGEIVESEIIAKLLEPRGIDSCINKIALSSEDKIFVFDLINKSHSVISHDWLSYIHTVRFDPAFNKLLVSSSGVDTIMEFDLASGDMCWEWLAWENGYNQGENPETGAIHFLTRSPAQAKTMEENGKKPLLISNPRIQRLPTALRAAFMNTAEYLDHDSILVTFFHHGQVLQINKNNPKTTTVLRDLTKPHGGMKYPNGYIVTDTAGGSVIIKNDLLQTKYDFADLPGKDDSLKDMEWLQISRIQGDNILTLDSNRNVITVFNPVAEKRMHVKYDRNWALQEFVFIGEKEKSYLNEIKSWFDNQKQKLSGKIK